MDVRHEAGRILVRLHRGEEVIDSLHRLAREHSVQHAVVIGIGALENLELGYRNPDRDDYDRRSFSGSHELLSLQGNLAWADGEPFLHAHVVLGAPDFSLIGGHLFRGTVSATAEIFLLPGDFPLQRRWEESIKMKLWSLDDAD